MFRKDEKEHFFQPIPLPLVLLVAVYIFYDLNWKRRFLPPGPTPWLFFGNILHFFFYKSIDDMFLTWKQKYGKSYSVFIQMFQVPFFNLRSFQLVSIISLFDCYSLWVISILSIS